MLPVGTSDEVPSQAKSDKNRVLARHTGGVAGRDAVLIGFRQSGGLPEVPAGSKKSKRIVQATELTCFGPSFMNLSPSRALFGKVGGWLPGLTFSREAGKEL